MKKICLISSSGGHFEQLLMLKPLINIYNCFIVTEKTQYISINDIGRIYYLKQMNRRERKMIFNLMVNIIETMKIFLREKPDIVISTGTLVTIPMCVISKLFRKKLIYIESFAKVNSPTLTGKFLYRFADKFYVQWEDMLKVYPNAIYKGGLY